MDLMGNSNIPRESIEYQIWVKPGKRYKQGQSNTESNSCMEIYAAVQVSTQL